MYKTLGTMTLAAALAAAVASGAQAQTIDGFDKSGSKIYTAVISPKVSQVKVQSQSFYLYDYLVTLQATSPKVNVNTFDFNFGTPGELTALPSQTYREASVAPGEFAFGTGKGLINVGDSAEFMFLSALPPTGVAGVSANSSLGGGGVSTLGPGLATVPEAGTFALAGLGLLPLALLARKRAAKRS